MNEKLIWLKTNVITGAGSLTLAKMEMINGYLQGAVLLLTILSALVGLYKSFKRKKGDT